MLSTILGSVGGVLLEKVLGQFTALFTAYINKQITMEELHTKLLTVLVGAAKDIEVTHAQELTKTYAIFMDAARADPWIRGMLLSVGWSQLVVLLWHQMGIPAIISLGIVNSYPSSGSTVEWAYALVGACVGFGPMILRSGPSNVVASLKALVGK